MRKDIHLLKHNANNQQIVTTKLLHAFAVTVQSLCRMTANRNSTAKLCSSFAVVIHKSKRLPVGVHKYGSAEFEL